MKNKTDRQPKRALKMQKGVVTFLDVVGWIGIWQKRNDVIYDLRDLTNELIELSKTITDKAFIDIEREPNIRGKKIVTEVKSISDTLVFLTPLNSKVALKIHGDLCKYAIAKSIEKRIPLRGATSIGEFNYEENIMIGPAIDEAADWHEKAEFFGCMLTPIAYFMNWHSDLSCWKEYCAPTKIGLLKTACVDWIEIFNKGENIEIKKQLLFKFFREMGPLLPKFSSKYFNTLIFFDACAKSNFIKTN